MNEIGRIVEQLKQVHEGEAWHGPSVVEALDGVSASGASRRPIGAAHSIWEIVHHVRVIDEAVRTQLTGETRVDEADWRSYRLGQPVQEFEESHEPRRPCRNVRTRPSPRARNGAGHRGGRNRRVEVDRARRQ